MMREIAVDAVHPSPEPLQQSVPAKRVYTYELKLAAVKAFLDEGLTRREVVNRFDIASTSTLKKWVIAYRRSGDAALKEKSKGRPCGAYTKNRTNLRSAPIEEILIHAENDRLVRKLGK